MDAEEEQAAAWEPLFQALSLHPGYEDLCRSAVFGLFYMDGPLSFATRHYLALMGASRHDCQFLIDLHTREFLRCGGPSDWIENGLCRVPAKLQNLDKLNRLLAHRPWQIRTSHLDELCRRSSPDNWALGELIQGAVILAHVHAFCSFIGGCGGLAASSPPSPSPKDASSRSSVDAQARNGSGGVSPPQSEVEMLMSRMAELREGGEPRSSQEEKAKQFKTVNEESSKLIAESASGVAVCPLSVQFTKEKELCYTDFYSKNNGNSAPPLKIHDYSWEDQGFSLISQFYSQLTNLLDEKFRFAQSLTYRTMGGRENVDTSPYRTAIWNYIQCLYGIRHDDYHYEEVNQLLSRQTKSFIKIVCCYPERTTEHLRNSVMVEFLFSEKVHVYLLILEARFQAELLYFLRAVLQFMN